MDSWSLHNGIGQYDEDGYWAKSGKISSKNFTNTQKTQKFQNQTQFCQIKTQTQLQTDHTPLKLKTKFLQTQNSTQT